jgi:SSS family solute:Na+ symporter
MILTVSLILAFSLLMLAIGASVARKSRTYDDFLVAGRSHGVFTVTLSILATAIGASATVGLMDQAAAKGFPYFWFLGAAAIGLLVQGLTVAGAIRETGARTFSEVVERQFGPRVHRVVSVLIVLGWTAIVAAQFKAAGSLVEGLSGSHVGYQAGAVLAAALIVCYTLPGGAHAVILTDVVQFAMIVAGVLGLLVFLLIHAPGAAGLVSLRPFNANFTAKDFVYHLLIVGGIYVISPNLFARCFAARDARTARRAVFAAAPVMLAAGVIIAYIGAYAAASGAVKPGEPVFATLSAAAGFPWSILFALSILAAIVSSADTTLLVTASIVQHDLLRRESVTGVRVWVAGIALGATALVLLAPGATLYTLLFAAYNVFAPAVVPLVFAGFYAPRRLEPFLVWTGLTVGVAAGLYGYAGTLIRVLGFESAAWGSSTRLYIGQTEQTVLIAGFCAVSAIAALAVWRARAATSAIKQRS